MLGQRPCWMGPFCLLWFWLSWSHIFHFASNSLQMGWLMQFVIKRAIPTPIGLLLPPSISCCKQHSFCFILKLQLALTPSAFSSPLSALFLTVVFISHLTVVNPKGNKPWILIGRTDAKAEAPIFWPPNSKSWLTGDDSKAGKDWR